MSIIVAELESCQVVLTYASMYYSKHNSMTLPVDYNHKTAVVADGDVAFVGEQRNVVAGLQRE